MTKKEMLKQYDHWNRVLRSEIEKCEDSYALKDYLVERIEYSSDRLTDQRKLRIDLAMAWWKFWYDNSPEGIFRDSHWQRPITESVSYEIIGNIYENPELASKPSSQP